MGKGPDKGPRTMDGRTLLDGTTNLLLKVSIHRVFHFHQVVHQENRNVKLGMKSYRHRPINCCSYVRIPLPSCLLLDNHWLNINVCILPPVSILLSQQ